LQEQAAAAERAKVVFKQQNNIFSSDGKRIDEQNLVNLNDRAVAARNHSSEVFARLTRLESIIRTWNPNATAVDASISDELGNPILTNLRQQYLDLSRKEAEYSAQYGRDHRAVVNLRNRLRDLRASTLDELRRIAEAAKSDYAIAKQRQAEIEKHLDQVISQSQTANKAQVTAARECQHHHSLSEFFATLYGPESTGYFPIAESQ
jgi:uncharacterized protein involved in exopolysaccharide biosynthesis